MPAPPCLLAPFVSGDWLVTRPPGHGTHAFDLIGTDEAGRMHPRSTLALALGLAPARSFFGWSRPVFAPAACRVVLAHDGERDRARPAPLLDIPRLLFGPLFAGRRLGALAGNHVLLELECGYLFLAHLQEGSVAVRVGDGIDYGTQLGAIGNTGSSLGPHLHVQLMDGPDPFAANVIPFLLTRYERLINGERVEHREDPFPPRTSRLRFPAVRGPS